MDPWLSTTVALLCLSLSSVEKDYREAVIDGDLAAVKAAIDAQPELLKTEGLHTAASRGRLEVMRLLLSRGADPNTQSEFDGKTPLHLAKNPQIVELLLSAGADPSIKSYGDETALQNAAFMSVVEDEGRKWKEIASLLIKVGADYDIISAIYLNDTDRVRDLLATDPRLAGGEENGEAPLSAAAFQGRTKAVELLLARGANPNTGRLRGFAGDDPFRTDWPILVECVKHPEVVRLLIHAGADVKSPVSWHGCLTTSPGVASKATPLHFAAKAGSVESAQLLMTAGVAVDATDGMGRTPLHYAAQLGRPQVVRFLVSRGADPAKRDEEGLTPLSFAEASEKYWDQMSDEDNSGASRFEARNALRKAHGPIEAERPGAGDR